MLLAELRRVKELKYKLQCWTKWKEKREKKNGNVILSNFLHFVYLTGAYTV